MTFKYFIIRMYYNLFLSTPLCECLSSFHFFSIAEHFCWYLFAHILGFSVHFNVFHLHNNVNIREGKWNKHTKLLIVLVTGITPATSPWSSHPAKCHVPAPWDAQQGGKNPFEGGVSCLASGPRNWHSGLSHCIVHRAPPIGGHAEARAALVSQVG